MKKYLYSYFNVILILVYIASTGVLLFGVINAIYGLFDNSGLWGSRSASVYLEQGFICLFLGVIMIGFSMIAHAAKLYIQRNNNG